MTNKEINEALLKRRGYRQYYGNKDNLSPLMYFFLMDASKQVFDKSIRKQPGAGKQKRCVKQMVDGYHLFFQNFFSAFTQDQTDYIIDKADELESFIQHHLDIAEIALQECVNELPLELQKEISSAWLCNLLAADAQDFHGECWKTSSGQPLSDRYIDQVLKSSKDYARIRFGDGPNISEKHHKRITQSVRVVANKICEWIYNDYKREIDGTTDSAATEKAA